jgi:hypothetical protein
MRHADVPEHEKEVGAVWFSFRHEAWIRKTGPARWHLQLIATDEYVWGLNRRYRNKEN